MKIYTVYSRANGKSQIEETEFVPEAFSWKGFLLFYNLFWAFSVKAWSFLAILVVFYLSFYFANTYAHEYKEIMQNITRVAFIMFGVFGNDLWRVSLEKRGYIFKDVIAAKDDIEASYKYFSKKQNEQSSNN